MSLPSAKPSQTKAHPEPTAENILIAAASQFSQLVQVHKLSTTQTEISPDDLAKVEAVKQAAIAKIIVLLTAYYKAQGWNPQDIRASVSDMLEQH